MTRLITTLDELKALPSGSVVVSDGYFARRLTAPHILGNPRWDYFGVDNDDTDDDYWHEFGPNNGPGWRIQVVYTLEGGFCV